MALPLSCRVLFLELGKAIDSYVAKLLSGLKLSDFHGTGHILLVFHTNAGVLHEVYDAVHEFKIK